MNNDNLDGSPKEADVLHEGQEHVGHNLGTKDVQEEAEKSLDEQVKTLEKELLETQDNLLRSLADLENLRKRAAREQEETKKYAVTHFARDMLGVMDNLERALSASNVQDNSSLQSLIEGIGLVQKELEAVLKRHKVEKIDSLHQKFDPNFHQAMLEMENAEYPSGTIVQVLQEGYMMSDRLLRPAFVGVSKGSA